MKQNKTYLHLGVTLIVSACAVLMFYDTFFQSRVLLDFFDKLNHQLCWWNKRLQAGDLPS